jgi:hypothetical protein
MLIKILSSIVALILIVGAPATAQRGGPANVFVDVVQDRSCA